MRVKPKKHLGQHFLKDPTICERIAQAIEGHEAYTQLLEIGPGTGALTQYLKDLHFDLDLYEVDTESIAYLQEHFPNIPVHHQDFLKAELLEVFPEGVGVCGNFPYNISSQIVFKVLENRHLIPEVVGMFQKEVAERICEKPGSKKYGVLSVLVQAYYSAEYLFTVDEDVFDPPPKVKSGVLRLKRKENFEAIADYEPLRRVVKMAFNQRRKTLRNSLKPLGINDRLDADLLQKRPEQLDYSIFVEISEQL